jgi:type IV pilus assembly protein PilF
MNKIPRSALIAGLLLYLLLLGGCVTNQPTNPDAKTAGRKAAESNTQLGVEYMGRGQLEVALGKLKKAVRDDPGYAPAHTVLAVLYTRLGETELAATHYKQALQTDPTDGDVNNNYGTYLCRTGKQKEAIKHFLTALDDPFYRSPAVALTNAAACVMGTDNLADADNYLRSALKYDPAFPEALLTMASLKYQQKDYLRSRAFLQRFEAVTAQTAESLFMGYEIETALRDKKTARQYLSLLNSKFPESKEAEKARRINRT